MRNRTPVDSFVGHFREFLHYTMELPDNLHAKTLKKLAFVALIDALSKVGSPKKGAGNRDRFVSFIRQFSVWDDVERISLRDLADALLRDAKPEFQQLKEWAINSLQKWPSRGSQPSPWWIKRFDPMPNEIDLWPKGGKIGQLTLEDFSHAHRLYSKRNSLVHELRTGVSEAGEWDYQDPYYRRTKSNGHEIWMLHYPTGFLSTLASGCLQNLEEWLNVNDINPYDFYKTDESILQELTESEETTD